MMRQLAFASAWLLMAISVHAADSIQYQVWVTNERGNDVTVIDGTTGKTVETIAVGKRPRGIHASADGKWVYVAVSGTPISGPPAGAKVPGAAPEEDDPKDADRSADGIVQIDARTRKVARRINVGADPEEFAVNADGSTLYVSNEDVATASVVNVESGKVTHIVAIDKEPEGVGISPDGKQVYVTCEAGGGVAVIDAASGKKVARFTVEGRPRSVAFSADGKRAFLPSETTGVVHVVDTQTYKGLGDIVLPEGARPMKAMMMNSGNKLLVSTGRGGSVCVVDAEKMAVTSTIKVGARAWGMALSPDEKWLYVANGPSNDVSVVEMETGKERRVKAGESPWGVAVVQVK